MEGLIEALLSNPFLIIIIIGALVSMFRDKPAPEEDSQTERPRPTSTSQTTQSRQTAKSQQQSSSREERETHVLGKIDQRTVTEHRDEQLEQLMRRLDASGADENSGMPQVKHKSLQKPSTNTKQQYKYKKMKKQMKKNASRQGMLNGIIMSEILGPPRARKPYRSVIQERRN